MANLSNINNKFLFTTGSDKGLLTVLGTTLQNSNTAGIELSNTHSSQTVIFIENTTTRGYELSVGGSSNSIGAGSFYIFDAQAQSARLIINTGGDATFAGAIATSGSITATASNATISAAESGGATTKIMGASVGRVGTSSNHNLEILSNNTAAITINTSQNATFAGSVTTTGLTVQAGTYHKVITSFPSTYKTNLQIGQQLNISNDAITDTVTFANTGTEAVSEFIFTIAGNEKLKIDGTGKATFRSTYIIPGFYGGEVTVGGSANIFGLQLKYDQNASTLSTLYHSPGYVNNDNLFKLGSGSGNTNQLVLKGDGNVGIGTTSPANKIQAQYSPVAIGNLTATNNDSSTTNFNVNAGLLIEDSNTSNGLALGVSGQANDRKSWIQSGHPNPLYGANLGTISLNPLGGNVGIGTTSPSGALHVKSSTATTTGMVRLQNDMDNNYETLRVESLGNYDAHIGFHTAGSSTYWWGIGIDYSDSGKFKISGDNILSVNPRLTIDTSGNVGIGITSPNTKLDVSGATGTRNRSTTGGSSVYETSKYFGVSGNSTANISINTATEFPPMGSGGFILVEVSASGYGNSGSNGLVFSYITGGYGGHYAAVNQPYHPVTIIVNSMQAGSCTWYNPSAQVIGITITTTNSAGINGLMRVKVTTTY